MLKWVILHLDHCQHKAIKSFVKDIRSRRSFTKAIYSRTSNLLSRFWFLHSSVICVAYVFKVRWYVNTSRLVLFVFVIPFIGEKRNVSNSAVSFCTVRPLYKVMIFFNHQYFTESICNINFYSMSLTYVPTYWKYWVRLS